MGIEFAIGQKQCDEIKGSVGADSAAALDLNNLDQCVGQPFILG